VFSGRRYKSQRFKDWLMAGVNIDLKPNPQALEVISYLAYESVAQVSFLPLTRAKWKKDNNCIMYTW
jgi:hypothetical protein